MLEWICYLNVLTLRRSRRHTFQQKYKNKFVKGAPASLKYSVITFLCRPDFTVSTADIELGNLTIMGANKPLKSQGSSGGTQPQRQLGHGYTNGWQSQSSNQNSLTFIDLCHWLLDYGVPGSDIDRNPTKFLLDLYKQKICNLVKKSVS